MELIETFVNYAESIKRCICLVYDPQKSATGSLALKAIKLRDSFLKVIYILVDSSEDTAYSSFLSALGIVKLM